jgi:hypothetical protein
MEGKYNRFIRIPGHFHAVKIVTEMLRAGNVETKPDFSATNGKEYLRNRLF